MSRNKHTCGVPNCDRCKKSASHAVWYLNNKDRAHLYHRKLSTRFNTARSGAKARELPWELTREQYCSIVSQPCYYWASHVMSETGAGLDRIDNSRGYTLDNVLPCCTACNRGRNSNFTVEEWKLMILAVESFREAAA